MTRKSKREIERDLAEVKSNAGTGRGIYIFTQPIYDTRKEAPRPELTVPTPDGNGYETAAPNVLPEEYGAPVILFLPPSVVNTWDDDAEDGSRPVSDLWDSLTESDLREEYRTREENGDPIPPLLEEYAPKE